MFDGKTAKEVHVEALAEKCQGFQGKCGMSATTTIKSYMPLKEMVRKNPAAVRNLVNNHGGTIPVAEFRDGDRKVKYIRIGLLFVCDVCAPEAEKAAAKLPSYVRVDISRAPKADPVFVGMSGNGK